MSRDIESKQQEISSLSAYYDSVIIEKNKEIDHLHLQVDIASKTSVEEVPHLDCFYDVIYIVYCVGTLLQSAITC